MIAKQPKSNTYRTLYRVNRAFDFISSQLGELGQAGLLKQGMLRTFQTFTGELQAEINQHVVGELHTVEERDWAQLGRVRNAIEKRIKRQ